MRSNTRSLNLVDRHKKRLHTNATLLSRVLLTQEIPVSFGKVAEVEMIDEWKGDTGLWEMMAMKRKIVEQNSLIV